MESILFASVATDNTRALPPRPSSICRSCWEGPFASYLGVLGPPAPMARSTPLPQGSCSYSTSWTELESRAGMGCLWCMFISALCKHGLDHTSGGGDSLEIRLFEGREISAISESTPVHTQTLSVYINNNAGCRGYLYAASNDPAAAYIVARSPIQSVGSSRALLLARECIDECVRGHKRCIAMSVSADPLLPTRVVDCNNPGHPRLASTDNRRGKYIALSYVWGEPQPHRTIMANIADYTDGIDLHSLPTTIRDAIHVTHALGLRFLWIDGLCIIQDSNEDKRRELARMHRIYRDAYLTIIAASARRVSEGFLQDRPVVLRTNSNAFPYNATFPFICPPRIPTSADTSLDCAVNRPVGKVHFSPTFSHVDMQSVEQYSHASEPISTRGWCLQEYFMSPRALIFTSETLQLRCQTTTRNVGDSFYDSLGERRLPDVLFLPDHPPLKRRSGLWDDVYDAWLRIVEDYTRRGISVPSDKLVACGAIAAEFQRVLRSDYAAGLWRETLPCDLLWRKADGADLVRPAIYRAPSWSWAAVDGPVTMPRGWPRPPPQYIAVVKVVQCEIALEDAAAPFGQVTGGSLVLRTVLLLCELDAPDSELGNRRIVLQSVQQARLRGPGSGASNEEDELQADTARPFGWAAVDVDADIHIQRPWAIPLERSEGAVEGLVVGLVHSGTGPNAESRKRVYRRIGFFHIRARNDRGLRRALKDRELPLAVVELV